MFDSIEEIKAFMATDDEDLFMEEVWEIASHQQDLDLFLVAYHYL